MRRPASTPDPERLGILAHELRSPVAALAALAEASSGARDTAVRRRLVGSDAGPELHVEEIAQ